MNAPMQAKYFDNRSLLHTLEPLQKYFQDENVYEMRVNRFGQLVCATRQGRVFHEAPFLTHSYLNRLTDTLLNANGLPRQPVNDVMLPDGTRGVICWPPAVLEGTVLIAFRKHLAVDKTLEQLDAEGRFDQLKVRTFDDATKLSDFEQEMIVLRDERRYVEFLKKAVVGKCNIAVAGPTNSGKSTWTRTLLNLVPRSERVMVLQDTHEVGSDAQDEIGYLMYGEQEGRLSARECLRTCMRLSPDRIFLTELRDDAAWDYLKSANTGHPGNIFSTHSESAVETPWRIADLVKSSEVGRMLDYDMILRTVHATVDVIIYMRDWNCVELLYDPVFKKKHAKR